MVAEGTAGGHIDCGFQASARQQLQHADGSEASSAAEMGMPYGGDARVQGLPAPRRRRIQVVLAGLSAVLLVVAIAHVRAGWQGRGGLAQVGSRGLELFESGPVVLDEFVSTDPGAAEGGAEPPAAGDGGSPGASASDRDAQLQREDEEFCAEFEGFLKDDCMEKRQKDRNAPKFWTANEVRNGLWKTEKALADLEIRQYKHAKEREMMHQQHENKMKKFKARMEVALTLIHQIQDEMGSRHSQLVERLKADIISTQARLKKYLDDGVEHVNGKLAILEEREQALTERLLEMVQAQYEMLNTEAEEVHAKEMSKDRNIHAFIEGVEAEQQAGDLRIEQAINATRAKLEVVKQREAEHYAELNSRKDAQAEKQAADVVTATTKINDDVATLRANLTATLAADKVDIRGKLHAGWTEVNASLAQLALDAEAAAAAIDSRLSVQAGAQASNNAEQDELISTLESDLHVFNLTVFDEIVTIEGNASRFEAALAAAESAIRSEQEAQKSEILAHINSAIAAVEQVHTADKAKMEADVAWMKPKAAKVAQELQDAIASIEAQREQDLAVLGIKLASNISTVNATYQAQHAVEKAKAEAAVQALAMALGHRRNELQGADEARVKVLADKIAAYKASANANNDEQSAKLAALRANFTAEAAVRERELLALLKRAQDVQQALETARAKLLSEHEADMAAAKAALSTTLDALVTHITDMLEEQVVETGGSITGDLTASQRSLAKLDRRIRDEDARLNVSELQVRALVDDSFDKTEARIAQDDARVKDDRARWDANTALGYNWHAWLDSNITAEFQRLDEERVTMLASLKWDLAAGLERVSERVETELAAIESRQRTRLAGNHQELVSLLATLANLQEQLDANATAQVQQLQQRQAERDAAHSAKVAALESNMGKDKDKVQGEITEFNATFQEVAARNEQAQTEVDARMHADDAEVRSSFAASLADTRARLTHMIARSNVTELEDLAEKVRAVMMKASALSWRMGDRGANLRALLEEVTQDQQLLFNTEGARLQDIKEAEVAAYQTHTQELSVLQSRVGGEEAALKEEAFKLHQDLLAWDSTARDEVPPAVEAMETRLDTTLRSQSRAFGKSLEQKVGAQLQRAQAQRSSEEATLAQLASALQDAKAVLDGHMVEQKALVENAGTTVANSTAVAKQVRLCA
jgi:hypothetical protein